MAGIKRLLQRIEGIGQRALIRSVRYPARRRPTADRSGARRILVIRHDAIGDTVMFTGFFRRIKEERPEDVVDTDRVGPPRESHFIEYMAARTKPLGIDPIAGDWRPMRACS